MNPETTNEPKGSISRSGLAARLRILEGNYKSQADALRAYGITKTSYRNWISEKSSPSLESIAKIAQAANVSLDWLAFGIGGDIGTPQPLPAQSGGAERQLDRDLMDEIHNSFNALYANRGYEEVKLDMNDLFFYYDELIAMDSSEERKITLKAFLTGRNLYIDTQEKEAAETRAKYESERSSA